MNNKIKKILLKLENSGYPSYIVGGYVRNNILGIPTDDVDIATPALPKEIIRILGLNKVNDEYGCVSIKDNTFNYDITTFRKEGLYNNHKPIDLEFVDDLKSDAKRRDFTINALYMDINGNIIDLYDGLKDIENKKIKIIGNIEEKLTQDPLRILRALRLVSEIGFTLDDNLKNFIKQNKQLLRTISNTRKKEELELLLSGRNIKMALDLINELNIFDELGINFKDDIVITSNSIGMWAQIENNFSFSNKDIDIIKRVKKIIKYGLIDNAVLYQYGLYPCYIAGEIIGISKSQISETYKNLPIYTSKDIKISSEEIMDILNIKPSEIISDIIFDLELNILNNLLENKKEDIKKYLLTNWRQS